MKTLILSDDAWAQMESALTETPAGEGVLARLEGPPPELPDSSELIRMARSKDETPDAFARAAAYRDAGRTAAEDTRLALNDLILSAHAVGVGPRVLSRWSGLQEARIYEIIAAAKTSV